MTLFCSLPSLLLISIDKNQLIFPTNYCPSTTTLWWEKKEEWRGGSGGVGKWLDSKNRCLLGNPHRHLVHVIGHERSVCIIHCRSTWKPDTWSGQWVSSFNMSLRASLSLVRGRLRKLSQVFSTHACTPMYVSRARLFLINWAVCTHAAIKT